MPRPRDTHVNKVVLGILGLVVLLASALLASNSSVTAGPPAGGYPEVGELAMRPPDGFDTYREYFEELTRAKGAPYAYDILLRIPVPPGVDLHLLGHIIGNELFKQQGLDGIHACTQDFRNACSHSIVVGLFNERGTQALGDIAHACRKAPGGKGAYTMCFHGLGHGVLAYARYNLEQAINVCKKTGTPAYAGREYIECVGGAIMEMQYGAHDPAAWEAEKKKYFKDDDPLYPCNATFMPSEVKPICYTYLTPHLFLAAGADLAQPLPDDLAAAFTYCEALPKEDTIARGACYGGFGKEFIAIVVGRDIRDIGSLEEPELVKIHAWCRLAGNEKGEVACLSSVVGSLFWGGENDMYASLTFCRLAEDPVMRDACYAQLTDDALYFLGKTPLIFRVCNNLPEPHRSFCVVNGT